MKTVFKTLVGSHNYNLTNSKSDKDYKEFHYPTFDDLYNNKMESKSSKVNGNDVEFHDVRKLPQMLWKANVNFIEVLFSKEATASDGLYENLTDMREDIARMNLPYLFSACQGMTYGKIKDLKRDLALNTSESKEKASKSAYQASRIQKFLMDYADNDFTSFEKAIFITREPVRNYLLDIKNGEVNPEYELEIIEEFMKSQKMIELELKYKSQVTDEDTKEELEKIIKGYVKRRIQAETRL